MTIRKRRGYLIIDYRSDHPPYHVHIFRGEKFIGRFDVENQRPMDKFKMTRSLRLALTEEGLLLGGNKVAAVNLRETTGSRNSGMKLKTCIVSEDSSVVARIKLEWNNPDIIAAAHLADVLKDRNYDLYIVDAKVPDTNTWPAPLLFNQCLEDKIWVFLIASPDDLKYFNRLPPISKFYNREDFHVSDLLDFVRSVNDPEMRTKIADVAFLRGIDSFFIRMANGKAYLLPLSKIDEIDNSPLTDWAISAYRTYFYLKQASGNSTEIPWDLVLYHCEPEYEFYHGKEAQGKIEESLMRIGAQIKELREEKGYSIKELADKAGMKRPNLSRLEHGRQRPSLETLERVANALNVPLAAIVSTRQD